MEWLNKFVEVYEYLEGAGSNSKAVVDESTIKQWKVPSIGLEDEFLQVAHEETGERWPHLGSNGHYTKCCSFDNNYDLKDELHKWGGVDDNSWLWIGPYLKSSGAPVNELDGVLGLDGGDGGVDVLGHHVATE